jgi:hypothetical protein
MKLVSTKDYKGKGVKCLVYGEAGVGKTRLCSTAPNPIIISAESGLLSLADKDIPVVEIKTMAEAVECYEWLKLSANAKYDTICLDSISDLAEVLLAEYKGGTKDPRNAYGSMADDAADLIRKFRDLPRVNVYFIAKLKRLEDDNGVISFIPSVPGQQLLQSLPYFFDELFALRHGKTKEKVEYTYLQTKGDFQWIAKDRSGTLDKIEKPNLQELFNKISGGRTDGTVTETSNE